MVFLVESYFDLFDYCFFRQFVGWESVVDCYFVVFLIMIVDMMVEVVLFMVVFVLVVVGISAIWVYKWIVVQLLVDVEVSAKWVGLDDIYVVFYGYVEGIVYVV